MCVAPSPVIAGSAVPRSAATEYPGTRQKWIITTNFALLSRVPGYPPPKCGLVYIYLMFYCSGTRVPELGPINTDLRQHKKAQNVFLITFSVVFSCQMMLEAFRI